MASGGAAGGGNAAAYDVQAAGGQWGRLSPYAETRQGEALLTHELLEIYNSTPPLIPGEMVDMARKYERRLQQGNIERRQDVEENIKKLYAVRLPQLEHLSGILRKRPAIVAHDIPGFRFLSTLTEEERDKWEALKGEIRNAHIINQIIERIQAGARTQGGGYRKRRSKKKKKSNRSSKKKKKSKRSSKKNKSIRRK